MRAKKLLSSVAVALGAMAPMFVGAGSAHAASGSDLDLTSCYVVDDHYDFGDGIDWYKLHYTIKNEGSASTGSFTSRAVQVWGVPEWGGGELDEAPVRFETPSLSPGKYAFGYFWVTKHAVDQKTWGIFLDINKTTGDTQTNDNSCTYHENNT